MLLEGRCCFFGGGPFFFGGGEWILFVYYLIYLFVVLRFCWRCYALLSCMKHGVDIFLIFVYTYSLFCVVWHRLCLPLALCIGRMFILAEGCCFQERGGDIIYLFVVLR